MYFARKNAPKIAPAFCSFYPDVAGFELLEDWSFQAYGGGYHTVPAGFWFDGGSVPAAFWQLTYAPHDPRMILGALPHDWAYCSKVIDRATADQTLFDALQQHGAIKAHLVKAAVRSFGGMFWRDSDKDIAFMTYLKQRIVADGRSLSRYGLA